MFLSSANDVLETRNRISDLITSVVNPILSDNEMAIQLKVDRWENVAPQRATGAKVNDDFVARALRSHVTLVLLQDRLGVGTEEEFDAILNSATDPRPELSVFWFKPTDDASKKEVERIEDLLECHKDEIVFVRHPALADPDDIRSWTEVFRWVLDVLLSAIRLSGYGMGVSDEVR